MRTFARITVVAALLAGCGGGLASGGGFSPTFPDNRAGDIEALLQRIRSAPPRPDRAVAVGVTANPSQLFAYDLTTGQRMWSRPAELRSVPHVAGTLVIAQERSTVVARDLATGEQQFEVDDAALHLIGADGDGTWSAFSLSTGGGVGSHSRLVVARNGSVSWDRELDHAIGEPAVVAGLVLVPWARQNVSVIDAQSGDEVARVRLSDAVVGHAFFDRGSVYLGQDGLFRITPAIASGSKAHSAFFEPTARELPGRPAFMRDAYQPPIAPGSAVHRVRYAWRPSGDGERVGLEDEILYFVFYRLVFALDPASQGVRWVHQHAADIVGASAVAGGLLVADERGGLSFVRASDGRAVPHGELGARPTYVTLRLDNAPQGGEPQGDVLSLRDQLLSAAQNTDARLANARVVAVRLLAGLDDPEVTASLADLCDDRRLPAAVKSAACTSLAERTAGPDQIVRALDRHAAFLRGTTAPPVGALAQAAARMHAVAAVPMLLAHLADPQTPSGDLAALLTALGTLGDRAAIEPIQDFIRLYHAEEADEDLARAMTAGVNALVLLAGPVSEDLLRETAADSSSMGAARDAAQAALVRLAQQTDQARQADQAGQDAQQHEATGTEGDTSGGENAGRPPAITQAMVDAALEPARGPLRECLRVDSTHPISARIIIGLEGTGTVDRVSVSPASAQACIEPLVRAQRFPPSHRGERQQVIYTLRR